MLAGGPILDARRSAERPAGASEDEDRLTADIHRRARALVGRHGYRKVAELPRSTAGWVVNDKRIERIWQRARGQRFRRGSPGVICRLVPRR